MFLPLLVALLFWCSSGSLAAEIPPGYHLISDAELTELETILDRQQTTIERQRQTLQRLSETTSRQRATIDALRTSFGEYESEVSQTVAALRREIFGTRIVAGAVSVAFILWAILR
jgi:uncharacterized coiled-coil protein SlyX